MARYIISVSHYEDEEGGIITINCIPSHINGKDFQEFLQVFGSSLRESVCTDKNGRVEHFYTTMA